VHAGAAAPAWTVVTVATSPAVAARVLATDEVDVVVGPSADGGYDLIGRRAPRPELFTDVPWSTPAVLDWLRAEVTAAGDRPARTTEFLRRLPR